MSPVAPRRPRTSPLLAATLAVLLGIGLAVGPAAATTVRASAHDKTPTHDDGAARAALARVETLVSTRRASARTAHGDTAAGDLTLALRDLVALQGRLSGTDARRAQALLARPTALGGDGILSYGLFPEATPVCNPDLCVHYVTVGPDAATVSEARKTLKVFGHVHDKYLAAGYREPRSDRGAGGDDRIDVYLGDLGSQGLYGYCTTDQPNSAPGFARWAYCAVDNDFSSRQFPGHTPNQNRQVTAAHEYFHAVQFAYDFYEDAWLLEATATWVEDQVYDKVNDNRQYLRTSQLTRPGVPLDTYAGAGPLAGFHYGTWSFFGFLTQRFPGAKAGLPVLVRDIIRRTAGRGEDPGKYSWQAVNAALRAHNTTGAVMLAGYAVANRRPGRYYAEGRSYPKAPLARTVRLGPGKRVTISRRVDHLATSTIALRPARLKAKKWKLRLAFDLGNKKQASTALVTTVTRSGAVKVVGVALGSGGRGVLRLPFSSRQVASVEVTLVNGSGRFSCWRRTSRSCQGVPRDDDLAERVVAKAYR